MGNASRWRRSGARLYVTLYSIFNGQGWCSVRARKVPEMVSGPTSLSHTLLQTSTKTKGTTYLWMQLRQRLRKKLSFKLPQLKENHAGASFFSMESQSQHLWRRLPSQFSSPTLEYLRIPRWLTTETKRQHQARE